MKCTDISLSIIKNLQEKVEKMEITPKLNIIQVGDNPASNSYIRNKLKYCDMVGIEAKLYKYNDNISESELIKKINHIKEMQIPFFVQLPLPKHIDENKILNMINPDMDVDGFTDLNIGRLVHGKDCMYPCTPKGIINTLKWIKGDLIGNNVLIINRSNIVGKPLAMMLLQEDCTVTIAHSKTRDLKSKLKDYDIIVTAIGIPDYFSDKDFNKGQVVIDVSINRNSDNRLCGDISKADYLNLEEKGVIFTEVPNGIGIMTVTALIEQVVNIYEKK